MKIYVDDGERVTIYPVKVKVAKAVMTLYRQVQEGAGRMSTGDIVLF